MADIHHPLRQYRHITLFYRENGGTIGCDAFFLCVSTVEEAHKAIDDLYRNGAKMKGEKAFMKSYSENVIDTEVVILNLAPEKESGLVVRAKYGRTYSYYSASRNRLVPATPKAVEAFAHIQKCKAEIRRLEQSIRDSSNSLETFDVPKAKTKRAGAAPR